MRTARKDPKEGRLGEVSEPSQLERAKVMSLSVVFDGLQVLRLGTLRAAGMDIQRFSKSF